MSLQGFQCALADLIADPRKCLLARHAPAQALAEYALTERERARLAAMVRDKGMSINCTLFRVNRLTPIYSVLPFTCRLLGPLLTAELDAFWAASQDATLQYRWEAWRFGTWLLDRIESGQVPHGPYEDAIRFELASYDAQAQHLDTAAAPEQGRQRVLSLRYDPGLLFDPGLDAAALRPLEQPVTVVLDASGDALVVRRIDAVPEGRSHGLMQPQLPA
ncbi:hypothetical protein [Azohydromonas caseinilytica]|uniref:Uncharacterized protein n=1 Tax=Azohydromonas caseinilytica TaxID=2728836 RepID=A0A848FCE1_9BURK|nr:hypothetical protein [Azohydromonas caseinilytica]NML17144.1 hypothetical protein [Azohydromonas caseinilytica]